MSLRWTEEEAKLAGLRRDRNGNWYASGKDYHYGAVSKPKRGVLKKSKGEDEVKKRAKEGGEKGNSGRFGIVVTSYRYRDLDPDNLCPKWFIDELVKAQVIPDDSSKYVDFVTKKVRKIKKPDLEMTVIEVFEINDV